MRSYSVKNKNPDMDPGFFGWNRRLSRLPTIDTMKTSRTPSQLLPFLLCPLFFAACTEEPEPEPEEEKPVTPQVIRHNWQFALFRTVIRTSVRNYL